MFGDKKAPQKAAPQAPDGGKPATPVPLLTVVGDHARMEGKFEIADSIQIECEVGGELNVGVKLVIGGKGAVNANVKTVDAIIMGRYGGNIMATGDVDNQDAGRVTGPNRGGIVLINGEVGGNVLGSARVEIRGTARVFGDVEAPVVVIEEGVLFEGHCRMTKAHSVEAAPAARDTVVSLKRPG